MRYTKYESWEAKRLTVKEALENWEAYEDKLFIFNADDDPWPFNYAYLESLNKNKKLYVLSFLDENSKLEE